MKEALLKFEKTVINLGGSYTITIPPVLAEHINLEFGSKIQLGAFEGKKGKFIAVWKE